MKTTFRSELHNSRNRMKIAATLVASTLALTLINGPVFAERAVADTTSEPGMATWYEGERGPAIVGSPEGASTNLEFPSSDAQAAIMSVTSNQPNSGHATENIESLRDKNVDTKWYTDRSDAITEQNPIYAIYSLGVPAMITAYELASANDEPVRDPSNWKIYGSNSAAAATNANDPSWVQIDSRQNEDFGNRKQTRSFSVTPVAAYKYFQLSVTGTKGLQSDGKPRLQIAD